MLGVDAVAKEFAGSARGDDEVGASDDGEPKRVFGGAICGVECEQAHDALRLVAGHQYFRADATIEDRHAETRRFLGEHLDHQSRRAGPATRRAPGFVVIRLIPEHRTQPIERDRQSEILQ